MSLPERYVQNYPELGDKPGRTIFAVTAKSDLTALLKLARTGRGKGVDGPSRYEQFVEKRREIEELLPSGVTLRDLKKADRLSSNIELAKFIRDRMTEKVFGHCGRLPESILVRYGQIVNSLISDVVQKMFREDEWQIDHMNEVKSCNDPAKLLLLSMDRRYDERIRFEAKRKLILIDLIAKIDTYIEEKKDGLDRLNDLMNERLFVRNGHMGKHSDMYLLSQHEDVSMRCIEVECLPSPPDQIPDGHKLTPIAVRQFTREDGSAANIVVEQRTKSPISRVLKMLRRDTKDMSLLDRDLNGLQVICQSQEDINEFQSALQRAAKAEGLEFREVYGRQKGNVGSAALELTKVNYIIGGVNYEFQIFTQRQFINYMNLRGGSWKEYEVARFFDHRLDEALFPQSIYPAINRSEAKETAMEYARSS
ncbi:hypothetical protein IPJ72_05375 [Candidatus Peregrinibacteria bacterium]|nr:MAG: hypothetical protein IPJ72_05375 [Candidatus Peregrinibacteria bacterium]